MTTNYLSRNATTCMKGASILLIILSHAGNDGFQLKFLIPLGAFAVAVFLILSGYGLMESYSKSGLYGFWKKRFLKVLLPYLLWIPLYGLYLLLTGGDFIFEKFRFWFVEYILIWYVIFYFTLRYFGKHRWTVFSLSSLALFLYMPNLCSQQSLSFIAGVLISEKKDYIFSIRPQKLWRLAFIFLAIGTATFVFKHWFTATSAEMGSYLVVHAIDDDDFLMKFLQLLPKIPFALFLIIAMSLLRIERHTLFLYCGQIAYELYLCHNPFRDIIEGSLANLVYFLVLVTSFSILLHFVGNRALKTITNFLDGSKTAT